MTLTFYEAPPLPRFIEAELPWRRRVAQLGRHRVHFVDHGSGPRAVVLMHGNPTWSFLWRKVIIRLADRYNLRLVVPDLLGFGWSDKLPLVSDHSLGLHVSTMHHLVEALDLKHVTLVGQDWGGPIAAGIGARSPERVHGMVFGNTSVLPPRRPLRTTTFHRLSHMPIASDLLFRGLGFPLPVLRRAQGDRRSLGVRELSSYAWPFRHVRDRAGPLALARMVPNHEHHPSLPELDAIGQWVRSFEGPLELVWGARDPILGRALSRHQRELPHAVVTETQAGHFLQEEVPDALARAIVRVAEQDRSSPG